MTHPLALANVPEEIVRAAEATALWRFDPVSMIREEFLATPDPWQAQALTKYPHVRRLAMNACKGPGKSTGLAWMILNFAASRPSPKIAVLSVTWENLRDNIWAELSKWGKRSKYIKKNFDFQSERIVYRQNPDNWFISARKWERTSDVEQQEKNLAGLHADYVMVVLDEVGSIPASVLAAADAILSSCIEGHVIIAGNPTQAEGPLYDACNSERDLWDLLEITGDPDNPEAWYYGSHRIKDNSSELWAREQIRRYGRKSPWVQTNVLGVFPTGSSDSLVSMADALDAFGRTKAKDESALHDGDELLGLDVARRGSNLNVLTRRRGDLIVSMEEWHGQDIVWTAGHAAERFREYGSTTIFVDDIGVGGGVTDILVSEGYNVVPVNVSLPALDKDSHLNLRSELAGELQTRFRDGRISLAEEIRGTSLVKQATTLRFTFTSGKRKLEDKDAYKKRTGESPDFWDSLALVHYYDAIGESVGVSGDELPPAHPGRRSEERVDEDEETGEWIPRRSRMRIRA